MATDNFKRDIGDYLARLKKVINKSKNDMAKDAAFFVVKHSPVRTGAYVESMRAGINEMITDHEPVPVAGPYGFPEPMNEGHAIAIKAEVFAKLKTKIQQSDFNDTIFISNSIPYASLVEYIGWLKTGPYHPFGKAKLELKAKTFLKSKSNAPGPSK